MRYLLRTDGTRQELPVRLTWDDAHALLSARMLDTVNLRHLGAPLHVMLVDDEGWESEVIEHAHGLTELRPVRARKPVNVEATKLYHANCHPGTTHEIVGDVLVCPDDDFD